MADIDFNPRTQGLVHPEQQNDREFFLGNFDPHYIEKLRKDWTTLRVGRIAYDEKGLPYPDTILPRYRPLPVFADRNEALAKHYTLRTLKKVPVTEEMRQAAKLRANHRE